MQASEVASAMCMTCTVGAPTKGKVNAKAATMIMPPPIPNKPARKPAITPTNTQNTESMNSIDIVTPLASAAALDCLP